MCQVMGKDEARGRNLYGGDSCLLHCFWVIPAKLMPKTWNSALNRILEALGINGHSLESEQGLPLCDKGHLVVFLSSIALYK